METKPKPDLTPEEKQKGCVTVISLIIVISFIIWLFTGNDKPEKQYTSEQQDSIKISRQFDGWDGSHIKTREALKRMMSDPESYENIETRYITYKDKGDTSLRVIVRFTGKNTFNATVTQTYISIIDTTGNLIDLHELN